MLARNVARCGLQPVLWVFVSSSSSPPVLPEESRFGPRNVIGPCKSYNGPYSSRLSLILGEAFDGSRPRPRLIWPNVYRPETPTGHSPASARRSVWRSWAACIDRGEAGIGKTRLVSELINAAREQGWAILDGYCFPEDRLCPYTPLLNLLRAHYWQRRGYLEPFATELSPLVPDLLPSPVADSAALLAPELEKRRTFTALAHSSCGVRGITTAADR